MSTSAISMASCTLLEASMAKAGLTAGHHVGVVAKDAQGMRGQRAGAHVEHAGQQLAGDLYILGIISRRPWLAVKVVVSAPAARLPCTGARRARLGLHFAYVNGLAEEVLRTTRRPFIHYFRHGGRKE